MTTSHRRILVAEDLVAIHEDYRKILAPSQTTRPPFAGFGDMLPGSDKPLPEGPDATFALTCVRQGEEAVAEAAAARAEGRPFALAFVDVRMPPGIDGVETARRLRALDPALQIVLCTAYSDHSLGDITREFPESDGLLILKKPFDPVEVQQFARSLCRKWALADEHRRLLNDLERRVEARTAELERIRSDLQHALESAHAAERAKTEFLANMSHEVRTPLNAMMGMAQLLRVGPLAPDQTECAEMIVRGGEALLGVVGQILDFTQLEHAPVVPTSESFDLGDCLAGVLETVRPRRQDGDVEFVLELAPGLPAHWMGDARRLRQALLHLASNAVKFTRRGRVTLSAAAAATGGLRCTMRDTGTGMTADCLARLFRPFYQADSSSTRAHGGVGLGLAIAHRLVTGLGGVIEVETVLGSGSAFHVRVPFAPTSEGAAVPCERTVNPSATAAVEDVRFAERHPLRVLVAEDSPLNQKVAALLLRRLGYAPAFAANGEEALAALAVRSYDVVLMDVRMPVLDGLAATRRLCARVPAASRPWIVAMTANALEADREACRTAGMDDYLCKPVNPTELSAVLSRARAAIDQRREASTGGVPLADAGLRD